jgi:toxin ParE1/3/4
VRKLRFLSAAIAEVAAAAQFYDEQQEHLGKRFVCAVEEGAERIKVDPFLYPVVEGELRRCLIRTFPFCILFRATENSAVIVALMHLRRKPGYWKKRIK